MIRRPWLTLLALLAVLVTACLDVTPPPSATPTPEPTLSPSPTPTALPSPTASPGPTPTLTASPTPSSSPTATPTASPSVVSAELAAQLQAALDRIRVTNSVPGMSAAVTLPSGARWAGVSGRAEVDPDVSVTTTTPFVIGSITKTFVAATIMRLADEGALSIDDPLSNWLPDFARADQISLRMLLSHTSGVFNYFEHPSYNRLVFGTATLVWTPQQVLDEFVAGPYCEPGTCYHYSNTGYILLGRVIEQQTGLTLGTVFRQWWFEPLGLDQTSFQGDDPPPPNGAYGHLLRTGDRLIELDDGTDYRPTRSAATVAWAVGAIESTAADTATWCQALYGGQLLSEAALAEMTNFAANPYSRGAYGLGTRTRLLDGRRMVGHTGSLRGYYAAAWHFPVEDVTVVVELNLGRIDPNPMADELARIALAASAPQPTPSPLLTPSSTPMPLPTPTPTPLVSASP